LADVPRPGSNLDTRETALLEALWRGDELAATLATAETELAALRARLARAEETIAELTEIGDAAQAAIDELRARTATAEAEAALYRSQREALAAELFAKAPQLRARPDANTARRGSGGRPGWHRRVAAWLRAVPPRLKLRR
jgi:chromosome segregation ATPase